MQDAHEVSDFHSSRYYTELGVLSVLQPSLYINKHVPMELITYAGGVVQSSQPAVLLPDGVLLHEGCMIIFELRRRWAPDPSCLPLSGRIFMCC